MDRTRLHLAEHLDLDEREPQTYMSYGNNLEPSPETIRRKYDKKWCVNIKFNIIYRR